MYALIKFWYKVQRLFQFVQPIDDHHYKVGACAILAPFHFVGLIDIVQELFIDALQYLFEGFRRAITGRRKHLAAHGVDSIKIILEWVHNGKRLDSTALLGVGIAREVARVSTPALLRFLVEKTALNEMVNCFLKAFRGDLRLHLLSVTAQGSTPRVRFRVRGHP